MIFAMEVLHETCKANKKVVADPLQRTLAPFSRRR
jgi:hypothetical protein